MSSKYNNLTDLEMLREVCERTRAIEAINLRDCPLACAIRKRLDDTRPALKAFEPSGIEPESTASMLARLPDPKNSPYKGPKYAKKNH
jgi:hypothetical protein